MAAKSPFSILSASDVAQYFVNRETEDGQDFYVLKTVKLVVLSQAAAILELGVPLFNDPIEAWKKGPVVGEVRFRLNREKEKSTKAAKVGDTGRISPDQLAILDAIWERYGHMSGAKLTDYTHEHFPSWSKAFETRPNTAIAVQALADDLRALQDKNAEDLLGVLLSA